MTSSTTGTITRGFPLARPSVQYASLCLGALHYVFGHLEQARRSVDESMRVAQHYGDHRCGRFFVVGILCVDVVLFFPSSSGCNLFTPLFSSLLFSFSNVQFGVDSENRK